MEWATLAGVDGHVRVYHGDQTPLPKRYVSQKRLCLRGTTDYWVNDQEGQPFLTQLAWGKKHLVDMVKMIAYRSATALGAILRERMSNRVEARSLLRAIFRTEADLVPDEAAGTLTVRLHPLANPVSDERARKLAEQLTAAEVTFPGTNLRLIYELVSA